MCGIVGYVGSKKVVPIILEGLERLEYRGYDSAGIAVGNGTSRLEVRRAPGKLRNLQESIREHPLEGSYGIGHTRWATHGRPSEENAHPHRDCSGEVAVVHNGIVENYLALKRRLDGRRPPVCHRDGHGDHRASGGEAPWRKGQRREGQPGRSGAGGHRRAERGLRSGGNLFARPQQDRGGAVRAAGGDWIGGEGVLSGLRHSRHSVSHPGYVLSGRWRHGRSDACGRPVDGF